MIWPPYSSDQTPWDFFLWRHIERRCLSKPFHRVGRAWIVGLCGIRIRLLSDTALQVVMANFIVCATSGLRAVDSRGRVFMHDDANCTASSISSFSNYYFKKFLQLSQWTYRLFLVSIFVPSNSVKRRLPCNWIWIVNFLWVIFIRDVILLFRLIDWTWIRSNQKKTKSFVNSGVVSERSMRLVHKKF